ncbi:MAG: urea amidolyase associated protein UAAP1 [Vicinamibacterales bacterium]|jgi:hypothetical protein
MNDILPERDILFEEVLAPGATWSHVLKRGTTLRITDMEGGANVGALLYNSENPTERYNMPDTLKAQHIAKLTSGAVLYSDMGRILCSVTSDTVGWHDPLGGCSNARLVLDKYGAGTYQDCRNDWHRNAYDSFIVELAKHGLDARDMTAMINFFSKVTVAGGGAMRFVENHSGAGTFVDLRAEMHVLMVLNSCQHPMDPSPAHRPRPVHLSVRRTPPPAVDDPCRIFRPENGRGFQLTERYFL